jgi:hypothetical protein
VEVAYGRPIEQTEDVHETTERLMTEIERLYATL